MNESFQHKIVEVLSANYTDIPAVFFVLDNGKNLVFQGIQTVELMTGYKDKYDVINNKAVIAALVKAHNEKIESLVIEEPFMELDSKMRSVILDSFVCI